MEITQTKVTALIEPPAWLIKKHEEMLANMTPLERELHQRAARAVDEAFFFGAKP